MSLQVAPLSTVTDKGSTCTWKIKYIASDKRGAALVAQLNPTGDKKVMGLISAGSGMLIFFLEIDHEIVSTVILSFSADSRRAVVSF